MVFLCFMRHVEHLIGHTTIHLIHSYTGRIVVVSTHIGIYSCFPVCSPFAMPFGHLVHAEDIS